MPSSGNGTSGSEPLESEVERWNANHGTNRRQPSPVWFARNTVTWSVVSHGMGSGVVYGLTVIFPETFFRTSVHVPDPSQVNNPQRGFRPMNRSAHPSIHLQQNQRCAPHISTQDIAKKVYSILDIETFNLKSCKQAKSFRCRGSFSANYSIANTCQLRQELFKLLCATI